MTKKTKVLAHRNVVIAAIAGITIIECVAINNGINGVVLTAVIGVLAGLAGWVAPPLKLK